MSEFTQSQVRACIRQLLDEGVLVQTLSSGQYPLLGLGEGAEDVARGTRTVRVRTAAQKAMTPTDGDRPLDASEEARFQRLRSLRSRIARIQGVPAYVIFSDKTLRELARVCPDTLEELRAVSGVGEVKAARYGRQILSLLQEPTS